MELLIGLKELGICWIELEMGLGIGLRIGLGTELRNKDEARGHRARDSSRNKERQAHRLDRVWPCFIPFLRRTVRVG